MIKRITLLLCLVALCMAMFCPISVQAATSLDPTADTSLTLYYQKEEQAFLGVSISIYRVAEAFPDGTFELIEPFSSYPITIHDITVQEQWRNTAATISSYTVANKLVPYREGITDDRGTVVFEQLETGLYLIEKVVCESVSGTYVFDRFMVYLPTPQQDGSLDYNIEAKPKCESYVTKTEYSVTKLWQDAGNKNERPHEITVDIYKDGELWETQILGTDNNWSYVWYVSDEDHSEWTVAERSVSDGYTVTVQQNGSSFLIINTDSSDPDIPDGPQTGDTRVLLPWILAFFFSGIMLIIIGIYGKRRRIR